ncbi:MAG: hypothetical protein J6W96_05770 [Alphaproteobacteria bacterium]|nr:hypothetical protein [Alphaproteobacteria bacterium]
MDKVSKLLAEAKPLYRQKQREKRAILSVAVSLCLCLGIWLVQPRQVVFDDAEFDNYFTALYLSDGCGDEIIDDSVVPLDKYGLYEVS